MLIDISKTARALIEDEECKEVFQSLTSLYKNDQKTRHAKIRITDVPLIKYIALMYDRNSPIKNYSLERRKEEGAIRSDLDHSIKEVFAMTHERARAFAHLYLRYENDKIWANLRSHEDYFWELQLGLSNADVGLKDLDLKSKLSKAMDETVDKIEKWESKLFGDNTAGKELILNFSVEDYALSFAEAEESRQDSIQKEKDKILQEIKEDEEPDLGIDDED
jgi:hypothetical protein